MTFPSIGLEAGEPFFLLMGGFPTGGKHSLPCEVPGGHCRGPRKAAPGWSRARTPGRNNVKACREPQERGNATGIVGSLRISTCHFLKSKGARSRPLGSRLPGKGCGEPSLSPAAKLGDPRSPPEGPTKSGKR